MNGGFGPSDNEGNLYYIRGIQLNKETNKFEYDPEYLLECLFHEFSHPIVNSIVDKYFDKFTNIDRIYEEALKNGLPLCYSQYKKTILYEYFVRANAYILNLKYYPETIIEERIINYGFTYLQEIVDYTLQNINKYDNYEQFFKNEMIDYFNNILDQKTK